MQRYSRGFAASQRLNDGSNPRFFSKTLRGFTHPPENRAKRGSPGFRHPRRGIATPNACTAAVYLIRYRCLDARAWARRASRSRFADRPPTARSRRLCTPRKSVVPVDDPLIQLTSTGKGRCVFPHRHSRRLPVDFSREIRGEEKYTASAMSSGYTLRFSKTALAVENPPAPPP